MCPYNQNFESKNKEKTKDDWKGRYKKLPVYKYSKVCVTKIPMIIN